MSRIRPFVVAIFWLSLAGLLYFAIREAEVAPDYTILSLKTDHGAFVIAESPAYRLVSIFRWASDRIRSVPPFWWIAVLGLVVLNFFLRTTKNRRKLVSRVFPAERFVFNLNRGFQRFDLYPPTPRFDPGSWEDPEWKRDPPAVARKRSKLRIAGSIFVGLVCIFGFYAYSLKAEYGFVAIPRTVHPDVSVPLAVHLRNTQDGSAYVASGTISTPMRWKSYVPFRLGATLQENEILATLEAPFTDLEQSQKTKSGKLINPSLDYVWRFTYVRSGDFTPQIHFKTRQGEELANWTGEVTVSPFPGARAGDRTFVAVLLGVVTLLGTILGWIKKKDA